MTGTHRIALIGYGEVGQTLAADLHERGFEELTAWDIQFPQPHSVPTRALQQGHVRAATSSAEALAGATLVLSAVTASQCVDAARVASADLAKDAWFVDLNSVAPGTKQQAARVIDAAGGRYVEAAVMAPIGPKRIASPILLGGRHAGAFVPTATALGFVGMQPYSEVVGRAAAAKMCRSVMVKGIEALLAESLLAARHYGVEDDVIASLEDLLPVGDWRALSRYMISRSLQHGTRRAEEMREAAATVRDAGIAPWMSEASVLRQDWAAARGEATSCVDLADMLDEMGVAMPEPTGVPAT